MKEQDALVGMLPKCEVGHTDGLTVLYRWFRVEKKEHLSALLNVRSLMVLR